MILQELIDKLNKIEDKNLHIVHYYDGWYPDIEDEDIVELTLYTDDDGANIVDYRQDNDEIIKCLQIGHGG